MESGNHFSGDVSSLEDESKIRTGFGPANNAALSNRVSTLIKGSGKFAAVPQGIVNYTANCEAALGTGSGPPCSSFREGSAGYPEPFREPT